VGEGGGRFISFLLLNVSFGIFLADIVPISISLADIVSFGISHADIIVCHDLKSRP